MEEGNRKCMKPIITMPIRAIPLQPTTSFRVAEAVSVKQFAQKCYKEYLQRIDQNKILTAQLELITREHSQLLEYHHKLQMEHSGQLPSRQRHRQRRTADEIERNFVCTAQGCNRSYGSEGSLFQHLKLKHPSPETTSLPKPPELSNHLLSQGI